MNDFGPDRRSGSLGSNWTRASRVLVLCALLSVPLGTGAQQVLLRNYRGVDGLVGAPVWSLHQDHNGYIWLGTASGPMRYDGVRFDSFEAALGRDTQQILEAENGDLWLGVGNGLLFDGTSVTAFEEGRVGRWPTSFDDRGNLWYMEREGVLAVWDGKDVQRFELGIEPVPTSYSVVPIGTSIWLGTREAGVIEVRVEGTKIVGMNQFSVADGLASPMVRSIVRDSDGRMYFGTRGGGVTRMDETGFRTFDALDGVSGDDVYSMLVNRHGELVVGTFDNGVSICSLPDFDSCRAISVEQGLYGRTVTALMEDREGTLWIGLSNGLAKVIDEGLESHLDLGGVSADTVTAVFVDRDETVWIGSFDGVARRGPDHEWKGLSNLEGSAKDQVRAILRDREGRLWIGRAEGLCSMRADETFDCDHPTLFPYIVDLAEDDRGRLWVGTSRGITRLGPGDMRKDFPTPSVGQIALDRRGRLWVATDEKGLFVIDEDEIAMRSFSGGLPSTRILDILVDSHGDLWVGGRDFGLAVLREGQSAFELVASEALGTRAVSWILEDEDSLWLGTSDGVVKLDTPTLRISRPFRAPEWTARNGLIWHCNARGIDTNGDLWFALERGLGRFRTRQRSTNDVTPTVAIEMVSLGGDVVYRSLPSVETSTEGFGVRTEFPHGRRTLRFEYRGLSFRDERDVRFRHRLGGYDDTWSETTSEPFKDYTNLDPGSYRFEVIAANGDGVWSDIPAVFSFEVLPAFWQTTWFRALVVIIFGFGIFVAYELRTRAIRRKNEELQVLVAQRTSALAVKAHELEVANEEILRMSDLKDRFFASVSHELRTPLNAIIGFSDVLLTRGDGVGSEKARMFHHNINAAGIHLLNLINNLLDMSKIEAGKMDLNLEELSVTDAIREVGPIVQGIADVRDIVVDFDVPNDLPKACLDRAKIRQTMLNLMSNAIKFSRDGSTVGLAVRCVPREMSPLSVESLEIAVTDHGVGIAEDEVGRIFHEYEQAGTSSGSVAGTGLGLALVKQFTEMQGGVVRVRSSPGIGSVFSVLLPLDARALTGESAAS